MDPHNWPSRMIYQSPSAKAHWMLMDPDRYFTQVRAERHAEAHEYVTARLAEAAKARRDRSMIRWLGRWLAKSSGANSPDRPPS